MFWVRVNFVLFVLILVFRQAMAVSDAQTDAPAEPVTSEAPEPAAETTTNEVETTHEAAPKSKSQSEILYRQAVLSREARDYERAEHLYYESLKLPHSREFGRTLMLELLAMYEQTEASVKLAYLLENFARRFPGDDALPELYLNLGDIYFDLGDFSQARRSYYKVLNAAIFISARKLEDYRAVSLQAQSRIAESYFELRRFVQAMEFYDRISRQENLPDDVRGQVGLRLIECHYNVGDFQEVILQGQRHLEDPALKATFPRVYYLLTNAYRQTGQPDRSLETVLELLKAASTAKGERRAEWLHWQEVTGNQVANAFYEKGDYRGALKVYQAIAALDDAPQWVLPIAYQMGLCFEKLKLPERASEAYRYILESREEVTTEESTAASTRFLFEAAERRLERLEQSREISRMVSDIVIEGENGTH